MSKQALEETQRKLGYGYAHDVIGDVLRDPCDPSDAVLGDLFRTLVLDEDYDVSDARAVYEAAVAYCEEVEGALGTPAVG